jgi:hypothetical protein
MNDVENRCVTFRRHGNGMAYCDEAAHENAQDTDNFLCHGITC